MKNSCKRIRIDPTKLISPMKDCDNCHGLGRQYFADSFDRDNGSPCPICERNARKQGGKLLVPYQR